MDKETPTLIGDFGNDLQGPKGNGPRKPPLQRNSSESMPEEKMREVVKEANKELSPPSPEEQAKRYLEGLSQVGVTQEEARKIMDCVLFQEEYSEELKLGHGVMVVLRTRNYADTQRMLRLVEAEAPQMPMHVNDIIARCNVSASLERYKDTEFRFPKKDRKNLEKSEKDIEDAFYERLDFVMGLPTPVVSRLMELVAIFDNRLFAVFAEGAPENF